MVHVGTWNSNAPCMVADANEVKRCSKRFPKANVEATTVNENGYPNYKRSATVPEADRYYITVSNNRVKLDNRYGLSSTCKIIY